MRQRRDRRMVAGRCDCALEQVRGVFRLHAGPLANSDGVLNLLITGLDRQCDHDLVDNIAHQNLLEVVQLAHQRVGDIVGGKTSTRRVVDKTDHPAAVRVEADVSKRPSCQPSCADDQRRRA